jgi:hypothetical protein
MMARTMPSVPRAGTGTVFFFGSSGFRVKKFSPPRHSAEFGVMCIKNSFLRVLSASFENKAAWIMHRMKNPKYAELTQHSVIPAKAGIQASGGGKQTWIP